MSIQQWQNVDLAQQPRALGVVLSQTSMASLGFLTDAFSRMGKVFETDEVLGAFSSMASALHLANPLGLRQVRLAGGLELALDPWPDPTWPISLIYLPAFEIADPHNPLGDVPQADALATWLRGMHGHGVPIAAHGSGILHLARAGLLTGDVPIPSSLGGYLRKTAPHLRQIPHVTCVVMENVVTCGAMAGGEELLHALFQAAYSPATARAIALRAPQRAGRDPAIVEAERWMVAHAGQHIGIADLAERFHMTHHTFIRRFARETGLSPLAYLQKLRIQRGAVMLRLTQAPVTEIAALCSYADAPTFRQHFRKFFHCTPAEYRRRETALQRETPQI